MIHELGKVTQQRAWNQSSRNSNGRVATPLFRAFAQAQAIVAANFFSGGLTSFTAVLVSLIYMNGGCYSWSPGKNQFFIVDEER